MIRPATPADIPTIVAMGAEMHEEAPHYRENGQPYSAEKVEAVAARLVEQGSVFVAEGEPNGEIRAMAACSRIESIWSRAVIAVELMTYVAPIWRGWPYAVEMIAAMEAWARENGCVAFQAGVSSGLSTERTARLWEARGWTRTGVLLEKRLDSATAFSMAAGADERSPHGGERPDRSGRGGPARG